MIKRLFRKKNGRARILARKSSPCLYLVGAGALLLGLMFTNAHFQRISDAPSLARVADALRKAAEEIEGLREHAAPSSEQEGRIK